MRGLRIWVVLLAVLVALALALTAYGYLYDWGCDRNGQYNAGDRCYVG